MATSPHVHAHTAPQGFIRKYIFSLDHKVIGLQYFLSGADRSFCRHVFVVTDAYPHDLAASRDSGLRRDQARDLSLLVDHARHHHGVLRAHHGAAGRVSATISCPSRLARRIWPFPS